MLDQYNRHINYLRISVTDKCNLRCRYCIPEKGITLLDHNDIISFEEIVEVIRVAIDLGINKIRLTGGEPLVRKGIIDLIAMISDIDGIDDLAMTTNGVLLERYARQLVTAGMKRVNISLDTLNPEKYNYTTRGGRIENVIRGIMTAKEVGLNPIKINCVLMNSYSINDKFELEEFCRKYDLQLRFIHQMNLETGEFSIVDGGNGGDCNLCNRLRLTANCFIKPCLFSNAGYNIREIGIINAIKKAVENKPKCGTLNLSNEFYNIGG